jgi:hypothetical protein
LVSGRAGCLRGGTHKEIFRHGCAQAPDVALEHPQSAFAVEGD